MGRWWTARTLLVAYVLAVVALLLVLPDRSPQEEAVAVMGGTAATAPKPAPTAWWQELFRPSLATARRLLGDVIPGLGPGADPAPGPADLVVYLVTGAELSQPRTFFATLVPSLAAKPEPVAAEPDPVPVSPPLPEPVLGPEQPPPVPPEPPAPAPAGPVVGIYHTHDWESYVDQVSPGTDPMLMNSNDPNRSVIRVGRELTKALQQEGIGVVQSEASHQKDGYLGAYGLSRETAKQMLAKNPSLRVLIDLHRDAIPRPYYVAAIKGQPVARIDLVIGSGDSGLPQPHWTENKAFANAICDAVNARYSGLCRGVLVKQDRYNQDLMPGAVLIEVGTSTSTMAESLRSVNLLAPVLADMIRQGHYPQG